jgi:L-ribulose-5-phosphate 4-epimerase
VYEKERRQIIQAGLELERYRLISLSGGNVSRRMGPHILVTPSGMAYETLKDEDVVVMDPEGKIFEGERRPSVDTVALLYIYGHMPAVNAIIHTHQPYATALGLVMDRLPAFCTTLVNATLGAVAVAPYSSAASLDMGIRTVENIGEKRAVILKNHGVVAVGSTLKEALYAAVYLEDAAKMYSIARAIGVPGELSDEQVAEAVEVFRHYGQGSK